MDVKALLGDAYKDDMSVADLIKGLEAIEIPEDHSAEIEKLKQTISAKNTEAADWKRKYQGTLDEATKKAQEVEEQTKTMQERLATLEKEKTVAGFKAQYLAMGYDEALAADTAQAMADNDMTKVFANQKTHQENLEKKLKAEAMKQTPKPDGAGGETKSEALKIAERIGKAMNEQSSGVTEVFKAYM